MYFAQSEDIRCLRSFIDERSSDIDEEMMIVWRSTHISNSIVCGRKDRIASCAFTCELRDRCCKNVAREKYGRDGYGETHIVERR